ncbi:hypothetical protein VVD49_06260 [Uliginosibacterium sp. H3]|uniref:Ceramidase n=1 Tax=Uliginosibacterium silvisoli TaxID=3114758 RepID=A0ABU6K2M0_9RHOO|nr:hypothetical protein [Uliginosibacterium sp. H3]
MDLLAHIDNYCERTDPSLWSEPLNALSNLAFLIAAAVLWRQAHGNTRQTELRCLATLIGLIGVCSGLFHFFGTVWGMILDVAGIALFILVYIQRYLRQLARCPQWACWLGVAVFVAADRAIAKLGSFGLNGSEGYLLPGVTLMAFAVWSRWHSPDATRWLGAASLVFVVSFSLRTLDMALCAHWPFGTHFAWHLLNALVLYCCARGLAGRR